jgi:hypothetical protein
LNPALKLAISVALVMNSVSRFYEDPSNMDEDLINGRAGDNCGVSSGAMK